MKGKSIFTESRQLAFDTYKECGGNVERTLRELKKKGLSLSKPTFYDWMDKFNFKKRLENADAVAQEASDAKMHQLEKMLTSLTKRRDNYDKYFAGLAPGQVDVPADNAHANLSKHIRETLRDLDSKPNLYRMAPIVMDEFVKFVKNAVKEKASQEMVFGLIDRFFDEIKPDGV